MTKDIKIYPRPSGNPEIQFSGSAYSSIQLEVLESGSIAFVGNSGALFSISDSLSGSLMSVNDISGLPILEVFSDDRVVMGSYNQNTLVVTGSRVGIGTNIPSSNLEIIGSTNDGNSLVTINQSGTGRGVYIIRNVASSTRTMVNFAQLSSTGGTSPVLHIQQSDTGEKALAINTDGSSTYNFYITDIGDIYTSGKVGIGTTSPSHTLTIKDTGTAGSATFTSGFAGSGWKIDDNTGDVTFDNLIIRGTMNIYELLIHQVKATNGSLWISNSGKVNSVSGAGPYTLSFDTGNSYGHGFAVNDLIRAQRWDPSSNQLYQSNLLVTSVPNTGSLTATLSSGNAPAAGYEYVRIGNTSDTNRQGAIYLTSDDNDAPYIDVVDGVTSFSTISGSSVKARMGKLSGITSAQFGALSGYGFYASGSAYLEGTINATAGGYIGGWTINSDSLTSPGDSITLDSTNKRITIHDGTNPRIYLGEVDGASTYGLKIFDGSGVGDSNILVELGEGGNVIAGWEVTPGVLQYDNSNGSIALDATNKRVAIYTGSIDTAKPKVVMGNLPTTGAPYYGFAVFSGTANADINIDTTYSVLVTKDKAKLAGWDLAPGQLKSGTVADINGNKASIALGAGATSATGTPTDGLFFVSASVNPVFYVGSNFSYVNNVLTAAGWTIGSSAISKGSTYLNSASPYVGIGTNAYQGAGFWAGNNSGYKMSVGAGSTAQRMIWDGTNLKIYNNSNAVVLQSTSTGAQIGGWSLDSNTIESSTSELRGVKLNSSGDLSIYSTSADEFRCESGPYNFAPGGVPPSDDGGMSPL